MNKTKLSHLCSIRFGSYAQPEENGPVAYIQLRQFNDLGQYNYETDEFLSDAKSRGQLLKDGDILFVSKGTRLFAWSYEEEVGPAVASSVFFVLEPNKSVVDPDYLTTILNTNDYKKLFQQLGAGSNIFSMRKSELAEVSIPLPPLERQKMIGKLNTLHLHEMASFQQLIQEKQHLFGGIVSKLIK